MPLRLSRKDPEYHVTMQVGAVTFSDFDKGCSIRHDAHQVVGAAQDAGRALSVLVVDIVARHTGFAVAANGSSRSKLLPALPSITDEYGVVLRVFPIVLVHNPPARELMQVFKKLSRGAPC